MSSATCICKDPNAPQFYAEKMPESVYINYTPSPTSDMAQSTLAADTMVHPAFKGIVYDKYLAMFNKQFTKHFFVVPYGWWGMDTDARSRLNPHSPTFGEYKIIVRG
jgi:hypothetical protein